MGTASNASGAHPSEPSLDDVAARLSVVEHSLSDWIKGHVLDSDAARQAERLELVTAENTKLKATCAELEYDLNVAKEDAATTRQANLLLKHDTERLQQSEDRLVTVRAELAETKELLVSTQRNVVLLEQDIEDLRQREAELLVIRAKYDELHVEHALVSERHRQAARRLDDCERDLERLESLQQEKRLESLQQEKWRLSETNDQLREQCARLRQTYDLARSQSNELDALVAQMADGVELMIRSRRWRLGNMLLSIPRRLVFRSMPSMVTDMLQELIRQYRDGRRASGRQWRRLAGDH